MRKRTAFALAAVLMCAAGLWADGKYWPEPAYPETPKIPLQRALIVYDNGIETLIVESSFESRSPSVGWVLPLPAEPTKLGVADAGMLKSLSLCLRPRILHDLHDWWTPLAWAAALLAPVVLVLTLVRNHRRGNALLVVLALLYVVLIGFLLPSLSTAGSAGAVGVGVEVKAFERVGNYEVSVLRVRDARVLSSWLEENGFQPLDAKAVEVAEDYIARKWCFVVARLVREVGGAANPHPISATFPVESPVYPMKMTGLAGSNTRVELFVIAEQTASAERFHRVASDMFGLRSASGSDNLTYAPCYVALETDLVIGNPDAGELLWGGCVVTHLSADLTPRQMSRDVELTLVETKPHRDVVFSARGRRELVRTVLLSGVIGLLLLSAALFRGRRFYRWWKLKVLMVLAALVLVSAGVVYVAVPVVPVRAGRELSSILMWVRRQRLTSAIPLLAREGRLHAGMTDNELSRFPEMIEKLSVPGPPHELHVNPFSGERMHMERTPGNFSVRRQDATTWLCLYDADCRETRIRLPWPPKPGEQPPSPEPPPEERGKEDAPEPARPGEEDPSSPKPGQDETPPTPLPVPRDLGKRHAPFPQPAG